MTTTYTQLQSLVLADLIDAPTAVQANVGLYINRAHKRLQDLHNFDVMKAKTSVMSTATATRVLAAVPSDFKELRGRPYRLESRGGITYLADPADRAAAIKMWGTADGGEAETSLLDGAPRAVLLTEPTDTDGARNFEVYPLSDGLSTYDNGQYRIVVPYWKYLAELTTGSQSNWLTNNCAEFIEYQAAAYGFFGDWDEGRAAQWTARANAQLLECIKIDRRRQAASIDTLVPRPDAESQRLRSTPPA